MQVGRLLFANCVRLRPTGERAPGSDSVEYGWPHFLPHVDPDDSDTAWFIRTDAGVQRQYTEWLRYTSGAADDQSINR